MMIKIIQKTLFLCFAFLFLVSISFAENTFERELVVKDQTRSMKVESVFKKLLQAYEDENAGEFLDLVSDDRFRQDYITFTDALYSDFRKYDIHGVDYWIDRVVSDNIKQFLYVKWEKRFAYIDNGRQDTKKGFSRFLFDEVNGKYLLVELAGNSLFGDSLKEWRDEMPPIAGTVKEVTQTPVPVECGASSLGACDESGCAQNGGYWYNNQCNSQPEENSCTGYWYNGQCYTSEEDACTKNEMYWYNNTCNSTPALPDLEITDFRCNQNANPTYVSYTIFYTVKNNGSVSSGMATDLSWSVISGPPGSVNIPSLDPGQEYSNEVISDFEAVRATVDSDFQITESNEKNNIFEIKPY